MAKALLVNPSYRNSYGSAKAAVSDPIFPTLGVLTTAAAAERAGHEVRVLDLSHRQYDFRDVRDEVLRWKPDVVAVTATTPLMNQARDISVLVKSLSRDIRTVAGGVHVSALPEESMRESLFDAVVVGEGDLTFPELMAGGSLEDVAGIWYRDGDDIRAAAPRPLVPRLDELPLPAWHLFDSATYRDRISRLLARRPPLAMLEFSRGCVFKCEFCATKTTMALGLRKKSPERCAEEARAARSFGYREFALADDIFTFDAAWARAVCEALERARTGMIWSCTNGIRVESADAELFAAMRRAGCYRVSFGFETGRDEVLRALGKGGRASLEAGRRAVRLAHEAGLETNGYFLLGLPADTEESMRDTIGYARSLGLDMMRFGVVVAFPGTPMFADYRRRGIVPTYDWDDYFIYSARPPFAHPALKFEAVHRAMEEAYRRAMLTDRGFLLRRLVRGLRSGRFLWDLSYLARFVLSPAVTAATRPAAYFARERWPSHDFSAGGTGAEAYAPPGSPEPRPPARRVSAGDPACA